MKDFSLANRINDLRISQGLSQKELADLLGITNKAISKWENASALPSVAQIIKLSEIFNVSIDELLKEPKTSNKSIYKIAVTGGPCSGKSTAQSWIQHEFSEKGYMVLFVPETATELILGGITPWTIDNNLDFQTYIMRLQLEKERLFEEAAHHIDNYDKILIVCDRGILDCKAYMTNLEFKQGAKRLNTNETALRDNYDAVFHLVTAADGASEYYSHENNAARYETKEEALEKDKRVLNAWMGHPHLRVIDNSTNFETKMKRLLTEISNFIGEPTPYEIERKFLIEYPNIELLEKLPNCKKVDIIQTYLTNTLGGEMRIRQRGEHGNYTYTKTIKKTISNVKRIELETRITKDEYISLLLEADTNKHQIRKTRYCLMHKNQYFEIDIYPFWKDKAIVELELASEKQKIEFPKEIKIIKEVTNDKFYTNFNLASLNKE